MTKKKLIVFDKDGTLIDIHHYWGRMIEIRSLLISNLCESHTDKLAIYTRLIDLMGFDLEKAKLKPEGPIGIKPRKYIVDLVFESIRQTKLNLSREDIEKMFLLVDEFSQKNIKSYIKVLPGVEGTLAHLSGSGVFLAVATVDLTRRAEIGLQAGNIERYFDAIMGGDQVDDAKPSPDMLIKLLKRFNVSPKEAVMIGDANVDQEMAKAAGVDFIGVKTGLVEPGFLETLDAASWEDDMFKVGNMLCV